MTKTEIIEAFYSIISLNKRLTISERWFKNNFSEAYLDFLTWDFPDNFSFQQKLYHYLYDDRNLDMGKCESCGKRCKFKSFAKGYFNYCSPKCSNNSEEKLNKYKETCLKRFGTTNAAKSDIIKERQKQTCLKRYGTESPSQVNEFKEKIKQTNIEKYGCACPLQAKNVAEKTKQTNTARYNTIYPTQAKQIKEKIRNTSLIRYGTDNPSQSDEVKEKIRNTNLERYGVEYPLQSNSIREKTVKHNIKKYGVAYPISLDKIKDKIKNTNMEKYGVEWFCMTQEARKYSNDSKPNKEFAYILSSNAVNSEREFNIGKYSFDFKVGDFLIEINPTITHNSLLDIFKNKPKTKTYHLDKSNTAKEHGYICIHVWDWDDIDKIVNMFKPKETLYARNLILKEVSKKECDEFLNSYHLQNTCKGQDIRYGLYKDDLLVQIMTFGKPRYNKNYELELLRLCSHKDYKIVGGAEKLFKHILDIFKPESIISYCDNSKFNGDVYSKLGFALTNNISPSKHWYNIKTKQHITDNFLRQRGFDQLFGTDYGKGTSNEELMLEHNFLPVYDCGQLTFTWTEKQLL